MQQVKLLDPGPEYDQAEVVPTGWELHNKQSYTLFTPAREVLYGGAAGGGKSHFLRIVSIMFCLLIPGLQVYLFRRKYPDLWKNHMVGPTSYPVLLQPLIDMGLCRIDYTRNQIRFSNGACVFLCHCQYDHNVYDYQGAEIHLLLMDELTHFSDMVYRFLRGRCRVASIQFPDLDIFPLPLNKMFPRIISGTNPGGPGHNWVKAAFIDIQEPLGIMKMRRKEGGMTRQFIPALLEDNPSLNADEYIGQLEGLGNEAIIRAMRYGDWDIVAGGMFDDLWKRAAHILPAFVIPATWRIDRSFDWGSSKPFSVGWWAESDGNPVRLPNGNTKTFPRGTVIRIAEWYGWNGSPDTGLKMTAREIAKGIIDREKVLGIYGRVRPGPADSSIFDNVNGNSIADDMKLAGVLWVPADKSPGSRVRGWEKMREMLKAGLSAPMETPGLFVFERCTQFIRTIPTLARDVSNQDDADTKAEDHIADETRYRVYTKRLSGGATKTQAH